MTKMTNHNECSRDSYSSRQSSNQYGDSYGNSRRGYDIYNDDYQDKGRYADDRALIGDYEDSSFSQHNLNNRYDDLIGSRRDTKRHSDSLNHSRQDPYSRMGVYNDDYDGEYRNSRHSPKETDSRNPYNGGMDPYDDGRSKPSWVDDGRPKPSWVDDGRPKPSWVDEGRPKPSWVDDGRPIPSWVDEGPPKPSYKNTDNQPNNRYRDTLHNRRLIDEYENGTRYLDGGSLSNAGYGSAMRDDDARRRYKQATEDGWVDDGRPLPGKYRGSPPPPYGH